MIPDTNPRRNFYLPVPDFGGRISKVLRLASAEAFRANQANVRLARVPAAEVSLSRAGFSAGLLAAKPYAGLMSSSST